MRPRWRVRRVVAVVLGGLTVLAIALAAASALSNLGLPTRSFPVDRLGDLDKARLAEATHLRQNLGAQIWPGWGAADIPLVLYNEEYAFLVGCADPEPGWVTVPGNTPRGGPWEAVPGDVVAGRPYFRQQLRSGTTPQAFTVRVNGRYAASMTTREWLRIGLVRQFHKDLPPVIRSIVPYRLALRLFLGESDGYISLVLHESFHAYQATVAPARLAAAERATALERDYERHDGAMRGAWREELGLLSKGAAPGSREEAVALAERFLAHRSGRRAAAGLGGNLVDYERQREWLEGLAKYVELESWRAASTTPGYRPLPAMANDADFRDYSGFPARRSRELTQMTWLTSVDVRFYYAGMAQAILLDRLMPGWKDRAFSDDVWLEELLAEAAGK